ncbi:hypothetical protein CYMTET_21307 [Cymbomonas tetramitiformis]|uniref:Uncharacterized protein n=1 Tax=Cymbomonas tetramitiformis TaxID=36881 RepID=A0AAE0G2M4_9CHLO|nr:hypothetical protein CYMTET_21307 [Cymbomonas tetramitiformis]
MATPTSTFARSRPRMVVVVVVSINEKHGRFGGNETNAAVLFAKLVPTIKEAFVAEAALFASRVDLEDVTTSVRSEANKLLFSTLELIHNPPSPVTDWLESSAETHPHAGKRVLLETARMLLNSGSPFQGTQELLGVRFLLTVDPHVNITTFQRGSGISEAKEHPGHRGSQGALH